MKKRLLLLLLLLLFYAFQSIYGYVETRVWTDKVQYQSGESIHIYFKIINRGPDTLCFSWPSSCQAVYSIDGRKPALECFQVLTGLTLYPDSSHVWEFEHTETVFPPGNGAHILKAEIVDYESYFAYNRFSYQSIHISGLEKETCPAGECDTSFIALSVADDTLHLFWQSAEMNACMEPLWGGFLSHDTFYVALVDTGLLCDCLSRFKFMVNFAGIPPGDYVLSFKDGAYGCPEFHIVVVGIDDAIIPEASTLFQNYPNPFGAKHDIWSDPVTVIPYQINTPGYVRIMVYNTRGQKVRELVGRRQGA